MSNGITLITATGERPQVLQLCARFIARQNWEPLQWIVVDDGATPSPIPPMPNSVEVTVLRPTPFWKPSENTLARNLLCAFSEVKYEKIFFIEDDDWYADNYLAVLAPHLGSNYLVGEVPARYYHFPSRRGWTLQNSAHASLCQTGITRDVLPLLTEICKSPSYNFIDIRLWEGGPVGRRLLRTGLSVGMKGLPGRPGIGIGHTPGSGDWIPDPGFVLLHHWIGNDVELYTDLVTKGKFAANEPVPQSVPESVPEETHDGIESFLWKGQRRYRCPMAWESGAHCEFDTYDLGMLREHMSAPHTRDGKPAQRIRTVSPIVTAEGKPIIHDVDPKFQAARFKE